MTSIPTNPVPALILPPPKSTPTFLDELDEAIRASPGITVKELAERFGTKPDPLSNTVKTLTGTTLSPYLKQKRLDLIIRLLTDPHLTYEEVAKASGFTTVQTLSRFLMRMIRRTAFEYREGHSNGHRIHF